MPFRWLDSGDHSGVNTGITQFRGRSEILAGKFHWNSTGIHRNDRNPTGIGGGTDKTSTWGLEGDNSLGATRVLSFQTLCALQWQPSTPFTPVTWQEKTAFSHPSTIRQATCHRPKWYSDGAHVMDLSICLRQTRWAALSRIWLVRLIYNVLTVEKISTIIFFTFLELHNKL